MAVTDSGTLIHERKMNPALQTLLAHMDKFTPPMIDRDQIDNKILLN